MKIKNNTKNIKVLAVGPAEGFITGQSLAFIKYIRSSRHEIHVINSNAEGKNNVLRALNTLNVIYCVAIKLIINKPKCIYITTSRSKMGAIKDIVIIFMARLRGISIVNHLHGGGFLSFRNSVGYYYGAVIDWAYRQISISIVLHDRFLNQYSHYPKMNLMVVYNFFDSDIINEHKKIIDAKDPVHILFLSNLYPEKGIYELISAVKNTVIRMPGSLRLKIAGAPISCIGISAAKCLQNINTAIGDTFEITYQGVADPVMKKDLLNWAHVMALPTYMDGEAVPLCLLEGAAAGCYLLSSDYNILSEIVSDFIGKTVEVRNVKMLEEALELLIRDRSALIRAQQINPVMVGEMYSEKKYVSKIDQIISDTVKCNS